jgi:hypothetical protein
MRKPALKICTTLAAALLLSMLVMQTACERKTDTAAPPKLTKLTPEPAATQATEQARKEVQPPNVRIKRDKEGVYTWEISGKDVGGILAADKVLRRKLAAPVDREKP